MRSVSNGRRSKAIQDKWPSARFSWASLAVNGSHDAALANNPELDYDDAVEVRLLLETLAGGA